VIFKLKMPKNVFAGDALLRPHGAANSIPKNPN